MNVEIEMFKANDIRKYFEKDSMLFEETIIASLKGAYYGHNFNVNIEIVGSPIIKFKGRTYTSPDKYPNELTELIIKNPLWWTEQDNDLQIISVNSYCHTYTLDGGEYVCDDSEELSPDIFKSERTVKEDLLNYIKEVIEIFTYYELKYELDNLCLQNEVKIRGVEHLVEYYMKNKGFTLVQSVQYVISLFHNGTIDEVMKLK